MSTITLKNLKDGDFRPFSTNPIYLIQIKIICENCASPGRKKIFKNLWCYYKHQLDHHLRRPDWHDDETNEIDNKIKITENVISLAKKIARGERIF